MFLKNPFLKDDDTVNGYFSGNLVYPGRIFSVNDMDHKTKIVPAPKCTVIEKN